ncbi:MAG: GTP-binding protein [Bacteroidota bacterium]|nr:GTP-binding protein [Bacteroidota bacterium]
MNQQPIPVNIITGFLGVGKTTAILNLLENKPVNERWAVIVNEFGKVAIDNKTMSTSQIDGVEIREVVGGCICCTANTSFQAALVVTIFEAKPQRIIIEPSGLGFLSALDEALQSERLRSLIDIRTTICIVDANQLNDFRIQHNETYKAQLKASDVILINKTDITPPENIDRFNWWMTENIGPKQYFGKTVNGQIDIDLLLLEPTEKATNENKPFTHFLKNRKFSLAKNPDIPNNQKPTPGKPVQISNQVEGFSAFGLIFSADDNFDKYSLYSILSEIKVLRLKGIFRTNQGIFLYNRINDYFSVLPVSSASDSRIEMIAFKEDAPDFTTIQSKISSLVL